MNVFGFFPENMAAVQNAVLTNGFEDMHRVNGHSHEEDDGNSSEENSYTENFPIKITPQKVNRKN